MDFDEKDKEQETKMNDFRAGITKAMSMWAENEKKMQENMAKFESGCAFEDRAIYYEIRMHLKKDQVIKLVNALEGDTS